MNKKLEKLLKELEKYRAAVEKYEKEHKADGITKEEQAEIDALKKKIQEVILQIEKKKEEISNAKKEVPTEENILIATDKKDWDTILNQSSLSSKIKNKLKEQITQNKLNSNQAISLINLVDVFYKYRYSNHEKYLGELNLGIEIDVSQYQSYLETATVHTLKEKGISTKTVDLSANLIMLLKGRLKESDCKEGELQCQLVKGPLGSTQINLSLDSKEKKLPKLTQFLNKTPFIKKSIFGIGESSISFSITGIAAYKENKVTELDLGGIGNNFSLAMDVITTDFNASLTNADWGASVAVGDNKMSFDLESYGSLVFGIKVADFSLSAKDGVEFTPIQGYVKWELSLEMHKKLFEKYNALMALSSLKVEISATLKTTVGLKPEVLNKKLASEVDELIKKEEKIVQTKQNEYNKKQKLYNELIDEKKSIAKTQKEIKQLDNLIKNEKNHKKKKKLNIQKWRRELEVRKKYKNLTTQLEKGGAKDLGSLKKEVLQKSKALGNAIKEANKKSAEALAKIATPAEKLMIKLMKKQASKRMISLMMKAVPGLNVISLAFDIYDAYTLVRDVSASYMEADTELEIDEEMERIANSPVDINEMPETITTFFYFIGAGGKITELKPKDVETLETFFDKHFSGGVDSSDFNKFMYDYGDFYDIAKNGINSNMELIDSIENYKNDQNEERQSEEGEVIETFEEIEGKTTKSDFFKTAKYKIVSGNILQLNSTIELDGIGLDVNSKGEERQITFPNNEYIKLKVVKILDEETVTLKVIEDYILKVEGFKIYRLSKNTTFIYNVNRKEIYRK